MGILKRFDPRPLCSYMDKLSTLSRELYPAASKLCTSAGILHTSAKKLYTSAGILHTSAKKLHTSARGLYTSAIIKGSENNIYFISNLKGEG
jgi:hypothetical protein